MVRKREPVGPKPVLELAVGREDAKARIEGRILKGREMKAVQVSTKDEYQAFRNEYYKWDAFNTELLKRLFTTEELSDEYGWFGAVVMSTRPPTLSEEIAGIHKDIDRKVHRLDSMIERLELIPVVAKVAAATGPREPLVRQDRSNRVFVVHGHDELAKTNLEIFLKEIGLDPIVLHRQADEGLTVIEKFEKHSDVGYAFILLTPDEVAYLRGEEARPDSDRKKEQRARPNVIFEFGYFVGKLGRSRVCCLHKGDVALPSDVNGMIYKKFSSSVEEVAFSIIKDLNASG